MTPEQRFECTRCGSRFGRPDPEATVFARLRSCVICQSRLTPDEAARQKRTLESARGTHEET